MELVFSLELSVVLKILLFGVSPFRYVDVMFIYLLDDNYVSNLADKVLSFQVFWRSCYFLGGQVYSDLSICRMQL